MTAGVQLPMLAVIRRPQEAFDLIPAAGADPNHVVFALVGGCHGNSPWYPAP